MRCGRKKKVKKSFCVFTRRCCRGKKNGGEGAVRCAFLPQIELKMAEPEGGRPQKSNLPTFTCGFRMTRKRKELLERFDLGSFETRYRISHCVCSLSFFSFSLMKHRLEKLEARQFLTFFENHRLSSTQGRGHSPYFFNRFKQVNRLCDSQHLLIMLVIASWPGQTKQGYCVAQAWWSMHLCERRNIWMFGPR